MICEIVIIPMIAINTSDPVNISSRVNEHKLLKKYSLPTIGRDWGVTLPSTLFDPTPTGSGAGLKWKPLAPTPISNLQFAQVTGHTCPFLTPLIMATSCSVCPRHVLSSASFRFLFVHSSSTPESSAGWLNVNKI